MLLKNDNESFSILYNTISEHFGKKNIALTIFETQRPNESHDEGYYIRFLLDRRRVFEYRVCKDRELLLGYPSMAIGPAYFSPGDFWDYENSRRFKIEPSIHAIKLNLDLLLEFLSQQNH